MLKVTAEALEEMLAHCEREGSKERPGGPVEACGYLAGAGGVALRAVPMRNADDSPTSYVMDGAEQARVQRALREEKLEILAVYHSHVATPAYPSARDIRHATAIQDFFDGHYVLVTLMGPGRPRARVFKIRDGHVTEGRLEATDETGQPRESGDR